MNTPGGPSFASVRTLLLCLLVALAAACGQRGPLYLPQPESQPEPRSAPQSGAGTEPQSPPATQSADADEDEPDDTSGELE